LQVWIIIVQFMIIQFMSFRFSRSWIDNLYLWSMYLAARLRVSHLLWSKCRQNYCWDHAVRMH
jgi:hypothetical protein